MELITIPRISKAEALELFGDQYKLAEQLGITRQAVEKWPEYLPTDRAQQIYEMFPDKFKTNGAA